MGQGVKPSALSAATVEALRLKLSITGQVAGSFSTALPTSDIATDKVYLFTGTDGAVISTITWKNGDSALYNGSAWTRIPFQSLANYYIKSETEPKIVLTNKIVNGNFATTGTWTKDGTVLTVAANVGISTGSGTAINPTLYQTLGNIFTTGNLIYVGCKARVTNAICTSMRLNVYDGTQLATISQPTPVQNQWYTLSKIYSYRAGASSFWPTLAHYYATGAAASGQVQEIKDFYVIDLTAAFGAGKEPSAAQMDAILSTIAYFEPTGYASKIDNLGNILQTASAPASTDTVLVNQNGVVKAMSLPVLMTDGQPLVNNVAYSFPKFTYKGLLDKIPLFRSKMLNKNKDVVVVLSGTSLTQGSLYATTRSDATTRPPSLHTNDFSSKVFDKLSNLWTGQQYRRYDHAFFTLIGAGWSETATDASWDDTGSAKNGLTKLTTAVNSGVSFIVPVNAWQFNFIYRTGVLGAACTVAITEGNEKMEVWNGSAWVEANGYTFTMLEGATTATKGNTQYQKRLKMRCKNKASGGINSTATTKTVTISKGNNSDKFMFCGVEWSQREFMLTVVNGARGSKAWLLNSLPLYQDLDIWAFNPDLVMCEITTHNWNGSNQYGCTFSNESTVLQYLKKWIFNEASDTPTSLIAKKAAFSDCEVMFYGDTMNGAKNSDGPFDLNGDIRYVEVTEAGASLGMIKTCYDNYDAVDAHIKTNHSDYIYIPVNNIFKSVSESFYGKHQLGMAASAADGETLSIDSTHWNDNGVKLVAEIVLPVFDF